MLDTSAHRIRGRTARPGAVETLGFVAMNNSIEMFLAAMISDEVFERHEGLRCLSLESALSRRSSASGFAGETLVYRI